MSVLGFISGSSNLINTPEAWTPLSSVFQFGRKTVSGERVSPSNALSVGAYFACLRVLAEDMGKIPFQMMQLGPDGRQAPVQLAAQIAPTAGLPPVDILESPNPEMSGQTFKQLLTHWAAGWGLGVAEIVRDGAGSPRQLWPVHPSRVDVYRADDGQVVYRFYSDIKGRRSSPSMSFVELPASDVFAIIPLGGDGLRGYSVAELAAEEIGVSIAARNFGAAYFANSGGVNIVLSHPQTLGAPAMDHLRSSWAKRHSGGKNAGKPLVLEEGMKVDRFDIPANEAQMLETRSFQVEEIARWFRIAPVKIGHNQNVPFANVESINKAHVEDTLMPWVIRWELEARRKLIGDSVRSTIVWKGQVRELMRGDHAARANFFRTMLSSGVMTPNEVRLQEGLPAYVGSSADQLYMQGAMATLDAIASGQSKANEQQPQGNPGRPNRDDASATVRPMVADAVQRVARKEAKAMEAATKRGGGQIVAAWAQQFATEQASYLMRCLEPAMASAESLGVEAARDRVADLCATLATSALPFCPDVSEFTETALSAVIGECHESE